MTDAEVRDSLGGWMEEKNKVQLGFKSLHTPHLIKHDFPRVATPLFSSNRNNSTP